MVLFVVFLYACCSFLVYIYLEFIYRSLLSLFRENIDLRIMPICLCYYISCYFFILILKANTNRNKNNNKKCATNINNIYEVNVRERHNTPVSQPTRKKNHPKNTVNTNIMLKFNRHKIEAWFQRDHFQHALVRFGAVIYFTFQETPDAYHYGAR